MAKIIIDTDIGIDDAFALRYGALTHELIAITTVSGNVHVDQATKNAKFFCHHYGLDIPVYRGASHGLILEPPAIPEVHGDDGLGGCYANPCTPDAPNAVQYLIDAVREHPQEITICAIGPLTNIAMALNLCPELPQLVKELVIMGGAFGYQGHTGNMSSFAEFNIYSDPDAALQVFKKPFNIIVLPLDVTYEVLISHDEIAAAKDTFLNKISQHYLDFSIEQENFSGMAVHDALTIAYLNQPEAFKIIKKPILVSTSGVTVGQTLIPSSSMPLPDDSFKGLPCHQICIAVDAEKVKHTLLETIRDNAQIDD